ncbi:MAG: hypothetical protein ACK2U9_02675, partial [Anaerolineae bacterium]
MQPEFSSRLWLGVGLPLALGAVFLGLGSLVDPASGAAAPGRSLPAASGSGFQARSAPSLPVAMAFTETLSPTAFLPFVSRGLQPNLWQGEYYANANLAGDPEYMTHEARLDYDWGVGGSP